MLSLLLTLSAPVLRRSLRKRNGYVRRRGLGVWGVAWNFLGFAIGLAVCFVLPFLFLERNGFVRGIELVVLQASTVVYCFE